MANPDTSLDQVVVIGAGIAGASVAAHLTRYRDRSTPEITIIDRSAPGSETTARSAAFFGFWGSDIARQMKRYGLSVYNDLLDQPTGVGPRRGHRYHFLGRLRVATTPNGADRIAELGSRGDPVVPLAPDEVHERLVLPAFNPTPATAALFGPNAGCFRPRPLVNAFLDRALDAGVTLRAGERVQEIRTVDGSVSGVRTSTGSISADHIVCAAGPWTPHLLADLDVAIPLTHSLAPVLILRPDSLPQRLPIVSHVESGVYARGHGADRILVGHHPGGSTGEVIHPDDVPDVVPEERRTLMRDRLTDLLDFDDCPVEREWVGVRSHTPDEEAIVGETSVSGLTVVGFDSSGIQLAPAAGDLVARQLFDRQLPSYAPGVSPQRF